MSDGSKRGMAWLESGSYVQAISSDFWLFNRTTRVLSIPNGDTCLDEGFITLDGDTVGWLDQPPGHGDVPYFRIGHIAADCDDLRSTNVDVQRHERDSAKRNGAGLVVWLYD